MILCCGEALIDFLPVEILGGDTAFRPFNGGSIYNVAVALGRLKIPVGFYGGLSSDFFGDQLRSGLAGSGVDFSLAVSTTRSSTLAFVRFDEGEPSYAFVDAGSAGRMLQETDLPELPDHITALHFGSISLIHDPAGASLARFAKRHAGQRLISLDPNIRAGQINDRDAFLQRLEQMCGIADIIKLSDVDMQWITSGASVEQQVAKWLNSGTRLVVMTRGSEGAIAYFGDASVSAPPQPVEVVDTIGAGDTFMAALLAYFHQHEQLDKAGLQSLNAAVLEEALNYAARAAALCVSRPGADPPWREELH